MSRFVLSGSKRHWLMKPVDPAKTVVLGCVSKTATQAAKTFITYTGPHVDHMVPFVDHPARLAN